MTLLIIGLVQIEQYCCERLSEPNIDEETSRRDNRGDKAPDPNLCE